MNEIAKQAVYNTTGIVVRLYTTRLGLRRGCTTRMGLQIYCEPRMGLQRGYTARMGLQRCCKQHEWYCKEVVFNMTGIAERLCNTKWDCKKVVKHEWKCKEVVQHEWDCKAVVNNANGIAKKLHTARLGLRRGCTTRHGIAKVVQHEVGVTHAWGCKEVAKHERDRKEVLQQEWYCKEVVNNANGIAKRL